MINGSGHHIKLRRLRIIFRQSYISYENALKLAQLQTLVQRRADLLYRFGVKTLKNPKTSHMIKMNVPNRELRKQEKYTVEFARTARFAKSPINAIAQILNAKL